MSKWVHLVRALQRGVALTNAKTWRVTSTAVAAFSAFLTAVMGFAVAQGWFDESLSPSTIMEISSLLVTVVFAVLSYLNVATDEEQGVKPKSVQRDERDVRNTPDDTGNPFL